MALVELSVIASYANDGERAVELTRQAQRIDRDLMPGWCARKVETSLPFVMVLSGYPDGVLELCVEALAQARAAGALIDQSDTLFIMTVLARQSGRLADARLHLRGAVDLATEAGYRMRLIDALDEGGFWCAAAGQYAAAVTLWSARSVQGQATGISDTPAELRDREQPLQKARQALDAAQVRAAEDRGAAMTLAAAVEFAIMMTSEDVPPSAAAPGSGQVQRPRTRADHPGRPGQDRRADRREAFHQRQHGPDPPGPHPGQERLPPPRGPDPPGSRRRHHLAGPHPVGPLAYQTTCGSPNRPTPARPAEWAVRPLPRSSPSWQRDQHPS